MPRKAELAVELMETKRALEDCRRDARLSRSAWTEEAAKLRALLAERDRELAEARAKLARLTPRPCKDTPGTTHATGCACWEETRTREVERETLERVRARMLEAAAFQREVGNVQRAVALEAFSISSMFP